MRTEYIHSFWIDQNSAIKDVFGILVVNEMNVNIEIIAS